MIGEETDAALLLRVARSDPAAWERLVVRHGRMVYVLVSRILGDANDAEDAFQETFLRLRRSAKTFRRGGNAAAWIATVAGRIALKILARRRCLHGSEADTAPLQSEEILPAPIPEERQNLDQMEVYAALKSAVEGLPDKCRLPIVLHFAGGLNLDQIATELRCDRSTVAYRLRGGLDCLRGRLRAGGFLPEAGGALPLTQALLSESPPPSLMARQMSPSRAVDPSMETATRAGGKGGVRGALGWRLGSLGLLGAATAMAGLAILGLRTSLHSEQPVPVADLQARAAAGLRGSGGEPGARLSYRWDFRQGLPPGGEFSYDPGQSWRIDASSRGGWVVRENRAGSGGSAALMLPVWLNSRPALVRVRLRAQEHNSTWTFKACLADKDATLGYRVWWKMMSAPYTAVDDDRWVEHYFWSDVSVQRHRGQVMAIRKFLKPGPSNRLILIARNLLVEQVEVHDLGSTGVPPELLDIERQIALLKAHSGTSEETVAAHRLYLSKAPKR